MSEKILDAALLERIVWDDADGYHIVRSEDGGATRWQRAIATVFMRESDKKLFVAHWYQGSTENCDHTYPDEAFEVEEQIRTVTMIDYVRVK